MKCCIKKLSCMGVHLGSIMAYTLALNFKSRQCFFLVLSAGYRRMLSKICITTYCVLPEKLQTGYTLVYFTLCIQASHPFLERIKQGCMDFFLRIMLIATWYT